MALSLQTILSSIDWIYSCNYFNHFLANATYNDHVHFVFI